MEKYILFSRKARKFYGAENGLSEFMQNAFQFDTIGEAMETASTLDEELKFKAYPL